MSILHAQPVDDLPRLLESFPALRGLDGALHARLAHTLVWHRVPRDTPLFAAGDPCHAFPLLVEGEIQVMRSTPDGHEIELYRVRPGESCIVSTSCLLGDAQYPARGQATVGAVLALLPQAVFDELIAVHVPFRQYVFGLFAERLGHMMQRVEDVAFRSLSRRIAAVLLDAPDGVMETTHERLAAQIGASREAVSRVLKKLEEAGCIALGRGRVSVVDRAHLQAEA